MAKVKSNKSYPTGTAYLGKKVGESEALGKIFVLGKKYNCVIEGALVTLTYLLDYNNEAESGLLVNPLNGRLYVLAGDGTSGTQVNTIQVGTVGLVVDWSTVIP